MLREMADVELEKAVGTIVVATAGAINPLAGFAGALASHVATNASIDSAWREHAVDLWFEILSEENAKWKDEADNLRDEFSRYSKLVDWLSEELGRHADDIANLKMVAHKLIEDASIVLHMSPDPRMRVHIKTAYKNSLRDPQKFTPVWMARLAPIFGKIGIDHVEMVRAFNEGTSPETGGPRSRLSHVSDEDFGLLREELRRLSVLGPPGATTELTATGRMLAEVLSPPAV